MFNIFSVIPVSINWILMYYFTWHLLQLNTTSACMSRCVVKALCVCPVRNEVKSGVELPQGYQVNYLLKPACLAWAVRWHAGPLPAMAYTSCHGVVLFF
jgi:hypothetical protein